MDPLTLGTALTVYGPLGIFVLIMVALNLAAMRTFRTEQSADRQQHDRHITLLLQRVDRITDTFATGLTDVRREVSEVRALVQGRAWERDRWVSRPAQEGLEGK